MKFKVEEVTKDAIRIHQYYKGSIEESVFITKSEIPKLIRDLLKITKEEDNADV